MRVLLAFVRAYPGQSAAVLLALLVAGMVEGASLSALLPMLSAMQGGVLGDAAGDHVSHAILGAIEGFGITPGLGVLITVVVAGFAARGVLLLVARRQVGYTAARVATDLRLSLLRALLAARWEFFLRQPVGKLANAMSTEVYRASKAYLSGATLVATLVQLVVTAGVALWVSWRATLVYVICSLAVVLLLNRLVLVARRAGRRQTKLLRSLLVGVTDSLQSVKSLKAMGREASADSLIGGHAKALNKALRREVVAKEALKAAQQPIFALLVGIGAYVGIQSWGLPVSTVMVLLVLLVRMLGTVGKVQSQYQDVATCESAYWALRDTIETAQQQVEPRSGSRRPTLEKEIRLEGVHFAYDDSFVLRDLNLSIPAGSITTLVGFSGAGKTTVVDLVIGLLRPQDGNVLVDGVPLADLDRAAWHRMLGYVPQETILLHDSVLQNVTLGEPSLGRVDAERALRAAGAWEFVSSLPEGMESTVGERGAKLSGGQRQRIMIARALIQNPKLLILDEATSALDPETEAALWKTLYGLRGNLTLLAISHRPALVEEADVVYRMEKGQAVRVDDRGSDLV